MYADKPRFGAFGSRLCKHEAKSRLKLRITLLALALRLAPGLARLGVRLRHDSSFWSW